MTADELVAQQPGWTRERKNLKDSSGTQKVLVQQAYHAPHES